jgi:hypothetical protein
MPDIGQGINRDHLDARDRAPDGHGVSCGFSGG